MPPVADKERKIPMNQISLVVFSVLLGSLGQVTLKMGADKVGKLELSPGMLLPELLRIARTPEMLVGILLFGVSFVTWIKVLTHSQLSLAYPMLSLGYINVVLLSSLLFNEPITLAKICGIALIVTGVLILHR